MPPPRRGAAPVRSAVAQTPFGDPFIPRVGERRACVRFPERTNVDFGIRTIDTDRVVLAQDRALLSFDNRQADLACNVERSPVFHDPSVEEDEAIW